MKTILSAAHMECCPFDCQFLCSVPVFSVLLHVKHSFRNFLHSLIFPQAVNQVSIVDPANAVRVKYPVAYSGVFDQQRIYDNTGI